MKSVMLKTCIGTTDIIEGATNLYNYFKEMYTLPC
jgi:hypothetical protein